MTTAVRVAAALRPGPGRPARAVLGSRGATVDEVAEEIARRAGPGAVLFGGLDRDALAAIGIDLDAVSARIGSSLGPEGLARAVCREPGPSGRQGRPGALVLLRRAHPDVFGDAIQAVISRHSGGRRARRGR